MSLIDDIRKDREAGTLDGWSVSGSRGKVTTYGHQINSPKLAGLAIVPYSDTTPENHCGSLADARRIARVPEMEAALIAADELVKAMDWYDRSGCQQSAIAVLAAKKACKEATK